MRFLLRVPVPWVFVLVYLAGALIQGVAPSPSWPAPVSRAAGIAGAVLLGTGAALAAWSLFKFQRARTTTTPGETSRALVTDGPYRVSRNPMYVSLTIAYVGEAALLRQAWPVVVLPLVLAYLQWTVIPLEEARLAEAFGERYAAYAAKVRRWL